MAGGGNSGETQGQDPRHPKSTYDSKYPYNRVEITESGHEVHYDDTPGKERIRRAHMSGTYEEISPDGKLVQLTVGHRIEYNKGGYTQTSDKNHDVKVHGSHRTNINGDQHSEVKGTVSSAIEGDHKFMVGGDSVSAVKGDSVHGVVGETVYKIGKGIKVKGDSKLESKIDAEGTIEFGKDLLISSKTKITLQVGQSTIVMTPSSITVTSDTNKLKGRQANIMDSDQNNSILASKLNIIRSNLGTKVEAVFFPPIGKGSS